MVNGTLDQSLPVVRNLARRKANAFVRRFCLRFDERDDIESHLVLHLVTRWPKFDSDRASVQTFASRAMDMELISILRFRLAQSRQPRELPDPDSGPTWGQIHQFRIDLDRAMARLPQAVRETASVLSWCSSVDAAEMGVRRLTRDEERGMPADATVGAEIMGIKARRTRSLFIAERASYGYN